MPFEKIKCPHCGSKNVIHAIDRMYVCTYCEQKFEKVQEAPARNERLTQNEGAPGTDSPNCPICGKDNSSNSETYACKLCGRSRICKDHIYFQESDNFFACSECMKCSVCKKPIDVPFYKKEEILAYCPDCDILAGLECVKVREDPSLEGFMYYYCPKCGNIMCHHDRFGDEVRAQMIRDMTFRPVGDGEADFDPLKNFFED